MQHHPRDLCPRPSDSTVNIARISSLERQRHQHPLTAVVKMAFMLPLLHRYQQQLHLVTELVHRQWIHIHLYHVTLNIDGLKVLAILK